LALVIGSLIPQPDEEGESDVEMGVGVFDLRFCGGANEPCA
jgi:hypothetical protein